MANKELDQMRSILSNLDSEATSKPQPSKTLNSGTAKIDGANPTSPSTNPATRREQYNNYIKTLNKDQASNLYNTVSNYKQMWLTEDQIYDNVLGPSTVQTEVKEAPTTKGVDLTIKGNFDLYNPVDWQNQPEMMQQYYLQANNDIKSSRRALSKLILQQDALNAKSGNVEQVTTLIDAVENAYDRGVFDTQTIANTLGVPAETISLIQQGKANELVTLNQEYVEDELKAFYRKEEDYDINLQRTMEDFNLAKTNLDRQYNSAMQTLKRNLFDDKRASNVKSAVYWISGSEYAVRVIEAKHQQNMDDLEWNYLYSSIQQKYSYTRAIEDYNKNIQRLSEDFDDSLKNIQASILQQFQEIDNKIGLTTEQIAKAYGTLQQNVLTAKTKATTDYLEALSDNENGLANALANTYWLDQWDLTTQKFGESIRTWDTVWNDVNSIWHILNSNDWLRIGTYTNSKWYTYNVYATREDGLKATIQLLKRWYYWMSLADAAQKWIGQWKDISVAKSVMARNWLKLTDKLSDANVEKFIQAMGQWEWTLKNGKTLEEWLKEWRTLGTSPTATWGVEEWEVSIETSDPNEQYYISARDPLYQKYAEKKITSSDWKQINDAEWQQSFLKWYEYFAKQKKLEAANDLTKSLSQLYNIKKLYNEAWWGNKALYWLWDTALARADSSRYNVKRYFNQNIAQWFIDTIVDSKWRWATYGALSDNEWTKLSDAYSALSLMQSTKDFNSTIDAMIENLETNIKELWWDYTQAKSKYTMNKRWRETAWIWSRVETISEYPTIPSLSSELNNPIISPERSTSIFNTSWAFQSLNSQWAWTGTVFQRHF